MGLRKERIKLKMKFYVMLSTKVPWNMDSQKKKEEVVETEFCRL